MVEFLRHEDMKYAVKKLDDSRFRSHEVGAEQCRMPTPMARAGRAGLFVANLGRRAAVEKPNPEFCALAIAMRFCT